MMWGIEGGIDAPIEVEHLGVSKNNGTPKSSI